MTTIARLYFTVEAAAFALARALAAFGLFMLITYAAFTLLDGLMRSFADQPIELVRDLDGVTIAASMSCCFPLAYQTHSNITIKFGGTLFGLDYGRYLDAFASIIVTIIAILMARQLFLFAQSQARNGDATVMLAIKTAPFWYFVSLLMAFAAFIQVLTAVRDILRCIEQSCDDVAPPLGH
jgi:hypothetical protein